MQNRVNKRQPEFPVVTRESRRNSRKTTWRPRHRKMRPFPATAPQEKSHVRNWWVSHHLEAGAQKWGRRLCPEDGARPPGSAQAAVFTVPPGEAGSSPPASLADSLGRPPQKALQQARLGAAEARGGPGQSQGWVEAHWPCHHICFRKFCSKGKTGKQTSGWGAGSQGRGWGRTRSEDFQPRVTTRRAGPLGARAGGPGGTGGREAGCRLHWPQGLTWARPRFAA